MGICAELRGAQFGGRAGSPVVFLNVTFGGVDVGRLCAFRSRSGQPIVRWLSKMSSDVHTWSNSPCLKLGIARILIAAKLFRRLLTAVR